MVLDGIGVCVMSVSLVHDTSTGSAASEAALWDDGIEAMLEERDRLLIFAAALREQAVRAESECAPAEARLCRMEAADCEARANDLSAEGGIQQMRLLAFMLANGVTSADLILEGVK